MNAKQCAQDLHSDIIEWRRRLHQIPEIGFDLFQTCQFVKDRLNEMGISYENMAGTGVLATICGEETGPTIALRADMDGLPIKEETGLDYASVNGNMHACGHDAHTAMLLGTAKILAENKNLLKGTVKMIFQPAEETTGGAKIMIDEGCMKNPHVDAVIGLHIGQLFKEVGDGQIGIRYGSMMAAVDSFIVNVRGQGGHGARPHQCIDPIIASAEMITSLQRIVSREIDPTHEAVLSICMIQGGTTTNVIPEAVEFKGTIRTLDKDDRLFIEKRFKEICSSIAHANRAEAEITYGKFYPAVVNDEDFTRFFAESAAKIVGKRNIVEIKTPGMGAEDMAYYLLETKGTFFSLGSFRSDRDTQYPHHHSKFDINEDVLWIGPAVFAQTVIDFFKDHEQKSTLKNY